MTSHAAASPKQPQESQHTQAMPHRKPHLHRVTHAIRRYLSVHVSAHNLKITSFIISLLSCLSSGSIMLFSLYATSLHHTMSFSFLQINFIASLSAIGMYLCLPVLGYLADVYGPALLSLISIWFFCPSYLINSLIVRWHSASSASLYVLATSFCFIGLATSALYFACLLTCAKIYPQHKGLAISLPVSCYGLSTLIGSQILRLPFFQLHGTDQILNLERVFGFYAVLYFIMGVLNFVSNSIVSIESDVLFHDEEQIDESAPLLVHDDQDDEDGLIPARSVVEPINHQQRYRDFLRDKSAWLILVSLILNMGPLESFQNNLGSIIQNFPDVSNLSNQVGLMATSSTVTRLVLGASSDYLSSPHRKYPICRTWLLLFVIAIGIVGQMGFRFAWGDESHLPLSALVILNGASYGGIFTIYPTVVASIWGIDMMGSTWGSFMVAPAIGSVFYSLTYGNLNDSRCGNQDDAWLGSSVSCLDEYFGFTGISLSLSLVIVALTWRALWWYRGFKIF